MSGGTGISAVFSTINQGRRYIEANGFWRKVQIKYAKNIVEESKDEKKPEWTSLKIPQGIMHVH
jgi:hypothetical protein